MDRYIKADAKDPTDYEIVSSEMWEFLRSKYGCDFEVRRYYQKRGYSFYTQMEVTFKQVPVIIITYDQLKSQSIDETSISVKVIQTRKSASYADFKKRVADCLTKLSGGD